MTLSASPSPTPASGSGAFHSSRGYARSLLTPSQQADVPVGRSMELVEMGFDFAGATFPRFQELDDMKLFVDQLIAHFS